MNPSAIHFPSTIFERICSNVSFTLRPMMRNGISNLRVSKIVVYIPYLALAWTPPPGAAGAGTANFEIVATERGGGSGADDDDDGGGRGGGSAADDDDEASRGGGVRGFDIDIYDSPILINTIILYLSVIPLYPITIVRHYTIMLHLARRTICAHLRVSY